MRVAAWRRGLVQFVNARAADIRTKRRSFFLVLLSAATRDPELRSRSLADARAKMNAQLQVPFEDTEMIAGALKYSRYPLPLRWLMKRIAAKAGGDTDTSRDYEYTDWAQVEAYSRRLADACEMN
jgi:menaquinone-dependent protoporphyrinogen oxidase